MTHLNSVVRYSLAPILMAYLCIFHCDLIARENPTETAPSHLRNLTLDDIASNSQINNEASPLVSVEQTERREQLLYLLYRSKMLKKVYMNIIYPSIAVDRNWEDNVKLLVTINRQGRIIHTEFDLNSKYDVFNTAALKAVNKSEPFYKISEELSGDEFVFSLSIKFRLTV